MEFQRKGLEWINIEIMNESLLSNEYIRIMTLATRKILNALPTNFPKS